MNPPGDFSSPDEGGQGEGSHSENESPAGNGEQRNITSEEKYFTQADVDRIIAERLSRERGCQVMFTKRQFN